MSEVKPLSPKQQAFTDALLASPNCNASEAARIAGYKGDVAAVASRLMKDPRIKEIIESQRDVIKAELHITRDTIINEYMQIINISKKANTIGDRTNWIRAVSALSKTLGLDAPTQIDLTSTQMIQITYVVPEPEKDDRDGKS